MRTKIPIPSGTSSLRPPGRPFQLIPPANARGKDLPPGRNPRRPPRRLRRPPWPTRLHHPPTMPATLALGFTSSPSPSCTRQARLNWRPQFAPSIVPVFACLLWIGITSPVTQVCTLAAAPAAPTSRACCASRSMYLYMYPYTIYIIY